MNESNWLISFLSRVYSMPSLHETQMIFGQKQISSLALQDCISYREGRWYEHQTICRKCYIGFLVRVRSKIYTPLYKFLDLISFSSDGQRSSCNRGAAGVSKGLFVTILAALFCIFCNVFSLVAPQHRQTEQQ